MDVLVFLIAFAVMYRSGKQGLSVLQCAWLAGLFQLTYMFASVAIGLGLSRRNSRNILLVSTVLCVISGIASLLTSEFFPLLFVYGALAVFIAIFFNAFQTFMRAEAEPGDLARAVGRYTLSWSSGSATGVLLSGFFYRCGFLALSAVTLLGGLVILGILLWHKPRPVDAPSAAEELGDRAKPQAPGLTPLYVWIGWLLIFSGTFVQRPIQTFMPAISAKAGVGAFLAALPLFLQLTVQALVGLAMIREHRWLYRRTPLSLAHGAAAFMALIMWWRPTFPICFLGVSLLGIYLGFVFFCSVYYASNFGRRAFNIGVNEFLVGLGSLAGLFASEWFIKRSGNEAGMYLVIALGLLSLLFVQLLVASFAGRRPAQPGKN